MACADRDSDLEIGLDLAQPKSVGVFPELRSDERNRHQATGEEASAIPLAHATDDRSRDRLRDGAHVIDDPARSLLVARTHVVDVFTANLLAVRPCKLLREAAKELDGLWERVDRPRIDEDERARKRRVSRGKVDGDHATEAVADDHGPLDPGGGADRHHVVRQLRDRVAVLGGVALPASAQVEGRDPVRPGEVVELRLKGPVVAAPAGDKNQLRLTAARPLVVQPQATDFRVRHDDTIISLMTLLISYLSYRVRRLRPLLDGEPIVMVQNGKVLDRNLKRERLTEEELAMEARLQQIDSLDKVDWAVLEEGGQMSFITKK